MLPRPTCAFPPSRPPAPSASLSNPYQLLVWHPFVAALLSSPLVISGPPAWCCPLRTTASAFVWTTYCRALSITTYFVQRENNIPANCPADRPCAACLTQLAPFLQGTPSVPHHGRPAPSAGCDSLYGFSSLMTLSSLPYPGCEARQERETALIAARSAAQPCHVCSAGRGSQRSTHAQPAERAQNGSGRRVVTAAVCAAGLVMKLYFFQYW